MSMLNISTWLQKINNLFTVLYYIYVYELYINCYCGLGLNYYIKNILNFFSLQLILQTENLKLCIENATYFNRLRCLKPLYLI